MLERLTSVPYLKDRVTAIDNALMPSIAADVVKRWKTIKQSEPEDWQIRSVDISSAATEQVRRMLESTGLGQSRVVRAIWPFDQFVAEISGKDVVACYDDLWYPSRDNLLIINDAGNLIVELNHEEILTVGVAGVR